MNAVDYELRWFGGSISHVNTVLTLTDVSMVISQFSNNNNIIIIKLIFILIISIISWTQVVNINYGLQWYGGSISHVNAVLTLTNVPMVISQGNNIIVLLWAQ